MDRDKEVYCKSCAVCIYTEFGLYAVCAGPCRNSFHISCIGMSREQRKAISQGVVWICKECFPAFNDWRSDKPNTSPSTDSNAINSDDIAELKSQVSLIMDTLRLISSHSMSPSRTNIVHSTPKASDELMNGTCNNSCDTERDPAEQSTTEQTTTDEQAFSLLLTNIDSNTSENDVRIMVHRCLGVSEEDPVKVVKLVSKHTDCSLLDYISFKVLVKVKYKHIAMLATTWPTGIKFRKFNCRSTGTWRPNVIWMQVFRNNLYYW